MLRRDKFGRLIEAVRPHRMCRFIEAAGNESKYTVLLSYLAKREKDPEQAKTAIQKMFPRCEVNLNQSENKDGKGYDAKITGTIPDMAKGLVLHDKNCGGDGDLNSIADLLSKCNTHGSNKLSVVAAKKSLAAALGINESLEDEELVEATVGRLEESQCAVTLDWSVRGSESREEFLTRVKKFFSGCRVQICKFQEGAKTAQIRVTGSIQKVYPGLRLYVKNKGSSDHVRSAAELLKNENSFLDGNKAFAILSNLERTEYKTESLQKKSRMTTRRVSSQFIPDDEF